MSNQSNTAAAFPIGGVLGVGEGQGTLPEAAPLSVPTEREDGPSDQPFDWSEYEDDISDAISDSIDMDWSARDGAKAVIRCLAALSASGPSGGGGWQSVPREPSDAMIQAACDATWGRGPISPEEAHRAGYVAMLHAAPSLDCGPLHAAFSKFVSAIKRAPISWETGVCCCGSDVVGHGFGDGHSPVDEGEYFISEAIKEAEAALSTPGSEAVK